MKNPQDGFAVGRIKSLKYTLRGAYLLLKTEHSIITQTAIAGAFVALGFYFGISRIEWMIQIFAIGLVLTAESLNTAIEKLCDFVHPDFHKKIGFIKDISYGAMTFAVGASLLIAILIYYPHFL